MERILFETPTEASYDAGRYLAANPDVAAAAKAEGGDAGEFADLHYFHHGRREGRPQLSAAFGGDQGWRHDKYRRFANILLVPEGAAGRFHFLIEQAAFPIGFGTKFEALTSYDSESANHTFAPFEADIIANPDKLYMDIGCGLRSKVHDNCLYVEVYPSRAADLIMEPGCEYPIASNSLDGIGCFAVLEHVTEPWTAAREMHRMLKPGGKVYIDYPFLQPIHGYPSHYFNATRQGLLSLFPGFDVEMAETLHNQTPDYTVMWIMRELLRSLTDDNARQAFLDMTVADLLAQAEGNDFWKRTLAATPDTTKMTLACGNTLIATKQR